MAKLYFKYGAMGSSKSANALMTKFNYEERNMTVWLIKPSVDTRSEVGTVVSRIGLSCPGDAVAPEDDILELFEKREKCDAVIADECQFFTEAQIDQMREIVDRFEVPVLCFGLRTDFRTKLFPGSRRLFELADSITEIKTICSCGAKATVNARISPDGRVITSGQQVFIGGNDSYVAMCHRCYKKKIEDDKNGM